MIRIPINRSVFSLLSFARLSSFSSGCDFSPQKSTNSAVMKLFRSKSKKFNENNQSVETNEENDTIPEVIRTFYLIQFRVLSLLCDDLLPTNLIYCIYWNSSNQSIPSANYNNQLNDQMPYFFRMLLRNHRVRVCRQ